ncbi:O-antigen ligase family protein [Georgenia wangjunii]|uniref:O-antigen ligase family protein n=1 Tax=Georgenia wangjunii TaxID=3117730 RepID=UPI002F26BBF6
MNDAPLTRWCLIAIAGFSIVPVASSRGSLAMLVVALGFAFLIAFVVSTRLKLSIIELGTLMLPIAFYAPLGARVNLGLADVLVPLAVLSLFARPRSPGRATNRGSPVLSFALWWQVTLWLSLVSAALLHYSTDLSAGIFACLKLGVVAVYLYWFYTEATRAFRAGDYRILLLWRGAATAAALVGILGVGAYTLGLNLGLSFAYRATGTFEDPNAYATYLIVSVGVVAAANVLATRRPLSWHLLPIIVAIMLTGSRAALASLVVAVLFAVAIAGGGARARQLRTAALASVAGVAVLFLALPVSWTSDALTRTLSLFSGEVQNDVRARLWAAAVQLWSTRPMLGIGPGQFPARASDMHGLGIELVTHNTYLSLLAEAGMVGLGVFLWLPLLVAHLLYRAHLRGSPVAVLCLLGITGLGIEAMTLNLENFRPAWAFFGIALAIAHSSTGVQAPRQTASPSPLATGKQTRLDHKPSDPI